MDYHHTLSAGTELIGEYRIIRVLGGGGFANTYLALDLSLQRDVAIKEYFPSEIAYREGATTVRVKSSTYDGNFKWGLERFVREARTLAKLRHQNIVRVFRFFDANNTAYIVLDFVKGADMEAWLKKLGRRPSQAELDALAGPLLDALELVHSEDILHRDIKPQNIYIRDEDGVPVLLDFGAARFSVGELTGTTAAIVSRGYSPHEAYTTDAKLQGPWTDIYGLAATFYRALFGEAPPESTGRVLEDGIVPATKVPQASAYRREFLEAIDWGLSVLPKSRPQTAAEWRGRLLAGAPHADTTAPASRPRSPVSAPPKSGPPPTAVPSKPSIPSRGVKPESRPTGERVAGEAGPVKKRRGGLIAGAVMMLGGLATLGLWQAGMLSQFVKSETGASATVVKPEAEPSSAVAKLDAGRLETDDAARKAADDEAARKAADEEAARKTADEEAARKAADEEAARKAADEEAARKAADEEAARKAADEEAARKAADEEAQRKAAEDEAQRKADEPKVALIPPQSVTPDSGLDSSQRAGFIRDIQGELKERRCYSGEVNGEVADGEEAIGALKTALEKSGRESRTILVASASERDFQDWLGWLRRDLERFLCRPEVEEPPPTPPKTPKTPKTPKPPKTPKTPKAKPAPGSPPSQDPFKPAR